MRKKKRWAVPVLLVGLMLCVQTSRAQIVIALLFGDKLNSDKLEFGFALTPVATGFTGYSSDVRAGLNLGLYFNIKVNDRLFIHPELIPKMAFGARKMPLYATGSDSLDRLFATGTMQRKINGMGLPVLIRYRLHHLIFADAGIQADWMHTAKDIFSNKINGSDLTYTAKVRDKVTRLDFGWCLGLSMRLKKERGMSLGIRLYEGFTNVLKDAPGMQRNFSWQLNIGIPVGGSKKTVDKQAGK